MTPQSYATHRHRPTLWLVGALSALLGFVVMGLFVLRQPGLISAGLLLLGFSVLCLVQLVRRYALRLQDRIIRLEMQMRLARLGRSSDFDRLSINQLIALRFASDAEMPALIDRSLSERLTSDQIKRAVTNWQADLMRT
jgi:hypothetical protein